MESEVKKNLEYIYSLIPNFDCKHCHKCCGPIVWYKPEELLIEDFMKKNKIKRVTLTKDDFKKNNMKCPYIKNNRCLIYPVRPLVCRLQGNISELKCKNHNNNLISKEELNILKNKYIKLIESIKGQNLLYSTRRIEFNR